MADSERQPLLANAKTLRVSALFNNRSNQKRRSLANSAYLENIKPYDDAEACTHLSATIGARAHTVDGAAIDFLHDSVKEQLRKKRLQRVSGLKGKLLRLWDRSQGWLVVGLVALVFSIIAYLLTLCEAWLFDIKDGYCRTNWSNNKAFCCQHEGPCPHWRTWSEVFNGTNDSDSLVVDYLVLLIMGTGFALVSSTLTVYLTTSDSVVSEKDASLFYTSSDVRPADKDASKPSAKDNPRTSRKVLYYAAGSGISEVKSILNGYVLRGFLGLWTLFVKSFGLALSVASGLSLGKEGPFVHIACCVGNWVTRWFPKYNYNEGKRREILSAACAAGVGVAFGAVGGVLFSLEETSTFFDKLCMWRTFICSATAYGIFRFLDPLRNGKTVMLEATFTTPLQFQEFIGYALLGVFGGLYGAFYCKANIAWSRNVRAKTLLGRHPIVEVGIIALITVAISYWNPFTKVEGPSLLADMFSECDDEDDRFVCRNDVAVFQSLLVAFLLKVCFNIVTFGIKVPAGVFIPTLCAGALAGRAFALLVGFAYHRYPHSIIFNACQTDTCVNPGRWALLCATAALVGVTRSTISLCVIVIELTGNLSESISLMIVTLFAKITADAFSKLSIYEMVIQVNELPYLEPDAKLGTLHCADIANDKAPVIQMQGDLTVGLLSTLLERHGGQVAGFPVLRVESGRTMIAGYIATQDLALGLANLHLAGPTALCTFNSQATSQYFECLPTPSTCNLASLMDTSPVFVNSCAPLELLQDLFVKLGVRYIVVLDDENCYSGIIEKDRWLAYLHWVEGGQVGRFVKLETR